ncbi:MAG: lamin tail domain-containing protein [Gelidibacter sp.]|nr:lamin tail domain-containing protein [Gelidibacter sp.]
MKNNKITQKTAGFFLLIFLFISCVKDGDFETPTVDCTEPQLTATTTIQQVKEMYTFGGAKIIETDVIIEGYVVSSDKSGNIYKSISIQDKAENPTAAIKISINQTNIYTKYNVGRKIYVKLKGLAVGYSFGSVQIGVATGDGLGGILGSELDKYILRSCEVAEIIPKKVAISDLNKDMLEMLIEIENVQFKTSDLGKAYGNADNTATVNRVLESTDNSCNFLDEVVLRNSGYASFKNNILPEGKGSVVAIFSNYYDDFQLYLRDTDDVKLTYPRCDYSSSFQPTITLAAVKKMYQGSMVEFGIGNNYVLEGYVVSSDEHGSFEKKLVIQDAVENATAGIQLLIGKSANFEQFKVGDKVFVKLNKLYMAKKDGILTIGFPKATTIAEIVETQIADFIYNSGENFTIIPKEILISEILNPAFENTLVKVKNVQLSQNEQGSAFTYFSGTNNGFRTLETCSISTKLSVFTNGKATFSNELFPQGKGNITGILSKVLELRSVNDVQFSEAYEACLVFIPKIMITEVADPNNKASARFVELYNAGNGEVNLTGWKLNKYLNGATTVSASPLALTGIVIPAGGFAIIAANDYKIAFDDIPNIETTYISGNGDDVYELVDNTGTRIDIFGVIGEDGNGTNWEYLDGRARRNISISAPNPLFTVSEWTIYSAAANPKITNPSSPQNAPDGFNPRVR